MTPNTTPAVTAAPPTRPDGAAASGRSALHLTGPVLVLVGMAAVWVREQLLRS